MINTPTRGIGDRTLDVLRNLTRERQITLWQAVQVATQENMLTLSLIHILSTFFFIKAYE